MSFGSQEYQHRFYRNQQHKKLIGQIPNDSRVLPLSNYHNYEQFYTPQLQRNVPENPLNLKVRAGEIGYNQPGWQGYRLKSYVIDKYGQNYRNYQNDRDTIEKFRREAQQHKRKLRFGDRYAYDHQNPKFLPQIRMKTQPPQPSQRYYHQQQSPIIQQNPERQQVDRYDVGILARIQSRQQQKRQQINNNNIERRQRRKLREYKKKYSKLKSKLKEELNMQRREQSLQLQENERRKLSRIARLMSDVSDRITKNSIIFNEGLKFQKELREMRQQSRSPQPIVESKVTILGQQQPIQNQYSRIIEQQIQENLPTPKVVYTHKRLSQSYQQLQNLKKQINSINQRIEKRYKQL